MSTRHPDADMNLTDGPTIQEDGPKYVCPCGAAYHSKSVAEACEMDHVVKGFRIA